MNYKDMKNEVHYIVTKQSDDGTFKVGDEIYLEKRGMVSLAIVSITAGGWVNMPEEEEGTIGMEVKPDMEWLQERCRYAYLEYANLNGILEEYLMLEHGKKILRCNNLLKEK